MLSRTLRLCLIALLVGPLACNISFSPIGGSGGPGELPTVDGIDPDNPNIERSSKTIDFDAVQTLRVDIPTGRVTIQMDADLSSATMRVTKTILSGGHSRDDLRELLTNSVVTAGPSFIDLGRLEIEARPARGLGSTEIAFDVLITLPTSVPTEIVLGNGPVQVVGLQANVEIRTNNGAITVTGVSGHVIARTGDRPIEITDTSGNIEAETSNADIILRVAPAANGFVMAVTHDGNIDLAVAIGTGAELRLDAQDGTVAANLNGFNISNLSVATDFLHGILNDGAGRIEARTETGEISFVGL